MILWHSTRVKFYFSLNSQGSRPKYLNHYLYLPILFLLLLQHDNLTILMDKGQSRTNLSFPAVMGQPWLAASLPPSHSAIPPPQQDNMVPLHRRQFFRNKTSSGVGSPWAMVPSRHMDQLQHKVLHRLQQPSAVWSSA